MTELIVITYPDVQRATEVAAALRHLQSAHLIHMDDLVVVTRDEDGNTELHQSLNQSLLGVASGAFWGALIGRLFAAPWLGAGIGAMTGALAKRLANIGVNAAFVRELIGHMPPGSSAVFGLVRRSTPDKVLPAVGRFGGTVLHTSLSNEDEERLQEALSAGERKSADLRAASRRAPGARVRRVIGGRP
jgi:uncharacterized membrane protein